MPSIVYLLHLDPPYRHAKHYTGWTGRPLAERLADHAGSKGARLLKVQRAAGGSWRVARTWTFHRAHEAKQHERRLKLRAAKRYCPVCRGESPILD
jgi:predicted GIY-YIG superfamily endonuclease